MRSNLNCKKAFNYADLQEVVVLCFLSGLGFEVKLKFLKY